MITLYDVLGAGADDDAESLKNAFRNAVKASHPDLHTDDPNAVTRFRQIVRANAILSDPDQRAVYDHLLEFEHWQLRTKSKRGMMRDTIRKLASDVITVVVLAAVLTSGYLLFMHLSKTSVAAVETARFPAAGAPERAAFQTEGQGRVLSVQELHELIAGAGPAEATVGPSVIVGAINGDAAGAPAPIPKNDEAIVPPSAPTATAGDDEAIAPRAPARVADDDATLPPRVPALVASDDATIAPRAPVSAANEPAVEGSAHEIADGGRGPDPPPSDPKAGDLKTSDLKTDDPKSSGPQFYRERGMASYRNGDLDRALADFDQAILLDPSSENSYIDRSIVLYRKAEFDRAFADIAQARRIENSRHASTVPARPHRASAPSSRN
ncbi:MAG TPA: DnaJ domain-containing protein [Xanthobacteraceae bacterium]